MTNSYKVTAEIDVADVQDIKEAIEVVEDSFDPEYDFVSWPWFVKVEET